MPVDPKDYVNPRTNIIVGVIVTVLVVLGILYFGGFFSPATQETKPPAATTSPAPGGAPAQPEAPKQTQ